MVENLSGLNHVNGAQQIRRYKQPYRLNETAEATDSVEFSSDVVRLRGVEGLRLEKVMDIRSQIQAGTYFTPEKLDKALDSALDQFFGS
ncbi:MAG: flagellar biosynthesis anti-sigma factor FlgM [Planctomycetota bacterium]|jgi:hypothetical protein|nr:flagellar biosynthesis anti-sigma factor FlgM [Planctomycetota bacterium]